ncbi:hypothetical protein JJJ17_09270 [Paracoccus caeni]|uniref:Uncharacterized protein n=1 Tax=Paracoccus caeni TaxID=657651 RepID=A0A934SEX3_9RHOB|nr:hypothetical protein [Paracoccus caeni]MBK4216114.1 hypothetical protein [Paracoccus caeni]
MTRHENLPPEQPAHPIDVPVYDFVEPTPLQSTRGRDVLMAIVATVATIAALWVLL